MAENAGEVRPLPLREKIPMQIKGDVATSVIDNFKEKGDTEFRHVRGEMKFPQEHLFTYLTGIVGGEDKFMADAPGKEQQFSKGALAAYSILSKQFELDGIQMPKISEDLVNALERGQQETHGVHGGNRKRIEAGASQLKGANSEINNAIERLIPDESQNIDAKYGAYVVYTLVENFFAARAMSRAVWEGLSKS